MADLTLAVAQSHAQAPHQSGRSIAYNAKQRKRKRKSLQSVARAFAPVLKYDPAQPRDAEGQWAKISGGVPKDFDKAEYDRLQAGNDTNFAIFSYVQGGARYMNESLRAGKIRHANKREVELLDAHMQRNTFTVDTSLTRTVSTYVLQGMEVGDTYRDDGYTSTTKNPAKIEGIREDIGAEQGQTTMTVVAPQGTGHIDVNEELGAHGYDNQEEVILPRGTTFQVVSKGPGQTMTVKVVKVRR